MKPTVHGMLSTSTVLLAHIASVSAIKQGPCYILETDKVIRDVLLFLFLHQATASS